jgi:hypothetical protein
MRVTALAIQGRVKCMFCKKEKKKNYAVHITRQPFLVTRSLHKE